MIAWLPRSPQNLLRCQNTIGNIFTLEEKDKNKRAYFFYDSLAGKLPLREVLTSWATLVFLYPQIERSAFLAAPFLSMLPAVMVTFWKVGMRRSSATQRGIANRLHQMIAANETGHCGFLLFFSPALCEESQYGRFYLMMRLFTQLGFLQQCFSVGFFFFFFSFFPLWERAWGKSPGSEVHNSKLPTWRDCWGERHWCVVLLRVPSSPHLVPAPDTLQSEIQWNWFVFIDILQG